MALTKCRKKFANEYLIDFNGTRAYKVAYPNVKNDDTAAAAAVRLLRNVKVKEYIDKRMKEREDRTEITQDMVVRELAAIAFSNMTDYAQIKEGSVLLTPTDNLSEYQKKALAGIKQGRNGIEVKSCDKVKALELLGRHLGMFKDKVEVSGLQTEMSKLDDLLKQVGG